MKILSLEKMEGISGEISRRDCMLKGAGMALGIITGFLGFLPGFAAAGSIAFTSGDCY